MQNSQSYSTFVVSMSLLLNLAHEKLVNILGGHGSRKFIHGSYTFVEIAISYVVK